MPALCESIKTLDLLQPIVLGPDNKLLCGCRRLEAFKLLGRKQIPAVYFTSLDEVEQHMAERDENTCRKPMLASELVALGKAIEECEAASAKQRQKEGGSRGGKSAGKAVKNFDNLNSTRSPRTVDIVGKAIGMSGPSYQRAKAVVEAAKKDPEKFGQVAEEMDRTGKVTPAYNKVKGIKLRSSRKHNGKPISALAVRAAVAALDALVGTLERIGVASRVAKHTTAIRKELEDVR